MILPPAGCCGTSEKAKAYWRGAGQRLDFGDLTLEVALKGMAAVADLSDAFGGGAGGFGLKARCR